MEKGYLLFVLNTHMPFVRNPILEHSEEENWLYEAMTESYIPLIDVFQSLVRDNVDFRITLSITPCLCDMLSDPLIQQRYQRYLEDHQSLARMEVERLKDQPALLPLAQMYLRKFEQSQKIFDDWGSDLTRAFRDLHASGKIDFLASSATHAFLPMWQVFPQIVDFQVALGARKYQEIFGVAPRGFWLPECAYYPGLDEILAKRGLRYFFLETHGIRNANPRPKYDIYAPILCSSGVAAFGRDWFSHNQIWSNELGYPGDPNYLNFHRDIGYELEMDYLSSFTHQDHRVQTGMKYFNRGENYYDPEAAHSRCYVHAQDFLNKSQGEIERLSIALGKKPVLVACFDTEHFGHWWREGPDWLNLALRNLADDPKDVRLVTAADYLQENPSNQVAVPSASSWGYKGYYEVWLIGKNHWLYPPLFKAIERLDDLLDNTPDPKADLKLALDQYLRELILAQNSDLAYILHTGTFPAYAENRLRQHIDHLDTLYRQISEDQVDAAWLAELHHESDIFDQYQLVELYLESRAKYRGILR